MSRPAVSQHLRVLADAGLVEVRPEGNRRLYRWRREGLRDAAAFVEEMWSDRLARLKAAAEREEWPERTRAAHRERTGSTGSDRRRHEGRRADAAHQRPPRDGVALLDRPGPDVLTGGAPPPTSTPAPAAPCRVEMGGGPVMVGEYLELVPHERIVFSFGWDPTDGAPPIAPGSTRVEVTLTPDDGDTIMTLRHTGLPVADRRRAPKRLGALPPAPRRRRRPPRGVVVSVDVQTEIDIDRPVADVAAYAADPDNAPEWYANIDSVEWKTEPPVAVGSPVAFVARFLGRRLAYTYEFVELVPERAARDAHRRGPVPDGDDLHLGSRPSSGGTHMTLRNRGEPAGFSTPHRAVHGHRDATRQPQGPRQAQGDPRTALRSLTVHGRPALGTDHCRPDPG